ncbi:Vms1/Ankzf1 family peptidyl-tRNA hydrolase [Streptomyces sp. NPDC089424]|uniref:baeRF2 domain-containing protein n=1 Tax=Streptomyces sp. NPDC089424 TaxID=3365917 RepID=UPI0037FAA14E
MDLAFLHPLYEHPGPWASVYVDLSHPPEDTPRRRSLTAEAMSEELAGQGTDEATCRAVRNAIEELKNSPEPHGRALFARAGAVVLDPPLARAPRHDRALWAPLPRATPLLDLTGEDAVAVVAYIDRRGADFELRSAVTRERAGSVTGQQWPLHRTGSGEWSERHFQLRVENTWEHNAAEIADALAVCQEETRADLLILVGDDRERRSVHERLPKRLHERVVDARHGAGSRLLDEDVEQARAAHVRRHAEAELERFLAARAADDEGSPRVAEGVPALVEAVREHRVEELVVRPDGGDTHREVWVGEDADQLAVRRTELTILGEQNSWSARVDDALLRAAVATNAPVVSLAPVEAAGERDVPTGGLGALLRLT